MFVFLLRTTISALWCFHRQHLIAQIHEFERKIEMTIRVPCPCIPNITQRPDRKHFAWGMWYTPNGYINNHILKKNISTQQAEKRRTPNEQQKELKKRMKEKINNAHTLTQPFSNKFVITNLVSILFNTKYQAPTPFLTNLWHTQISL